jgi:hypothetical protein
LACPKTFSGCQVLGQWQEPNLQLL